MLDEQGIEYVYREYSEEPLSETEIRRVLGLLELTPHDVLRRRDKAFKELDLTGDEDADTLIAHMAEHPTLLQRPIAVLGERAVVGRPAERILEIVDGEGSS